MSHVHEFKCWPEYYARLEDGSERFVVPRHFRVGDQIRLREWHPWSEAFTGRELVKVVRLDEVLA